MGKTKRIVELIGWRIIERMSHTDGFEYDRVDDADDGIEWYQAGGAGDYDYRLSKDNEELCDELETAYEKSKQGYPTFFR